MNNGMTYVQHDGVMAWRREWCVALVLLVLFSTPMGLLSQTGKPSGAALSPISPENDPARFEEAKRWISHSIEAYGGNQRLTAILDLSFASKSTGQDGQPVQFKVYFKGSDRFRSEVTGTNFFAATIANGPSAWLKSDQILIELTSGDVDPLEVSTLLQSQPYIIYDRLAKWWDQGLKMVEGTQYQAVGVSGFLAKSYTRGEILLDPITFLIRRFEFEQEVESKQGKGVRKYDLWYEAYKSFDGVQLPTRVTSVQGGVKSIVTLSDFKINAGIPDSYFEKPQ